MTTITQGVLAGFTAARIERRGYEWKSARELEVDEGRWAVKHRHDVGHTIQLPDIAVWVPGSQKPVAIVCEDTRRREDRQRWRLEGWRDAINAGRYECVQYDCANEPLATWIKNLGKKIGLNRPELRSVVQMPPEKIATLSPVDQNAALPAPEPEAARPQLRLVKDPDPAPPPQKPVPITAQPRQREEPEPYVEEPETPEEYERRRQHYYEIFGSYDSFGPPEKPKRRWFR
jgi:hypothetical protein